MAVLTLIALLLAFFLLPSPFGWLVVLVAATVDLFETALFLRWSRRRRAVVGVETLVGRRGLVIRPLQPRGQVRVDGEIWEAEGGELLAPGAEVVVTAVDGRDDDLRPGREQLSALRLPDLPVDPHLAARLQRADHEAAPADEGLDAHDRAAPPRPAQEQRRLEQIDGGRDEHDEPPERRRQQEERQQEGDQGEHGHHSLRVLENDEGRPWAPFATCSWRVSRGSCRRARGRRARGTPLPPHRPGAGRA